MTVQRWHGGELRWDFWTADWAILAPGRDARPHGGAPCPFCPGPGQDAPAETWRLAGPDGTWRIRAVPNRYAVSDHHEVVIESPDHDWDLATATEDEVVDVLHAWQHRHRTLRIGTGQVVIFRNHGLAAGVSQTHPHSQVVGLPVMSAATRRELDTLRAHYRTTSHRLTDELVTSELAYGRRVIVADGTAIAFVPFAPTTDFELRIAPLTSRADFAAVPARELPAIARILHAALAALRHELDDPAYHLIVHTAPTGWEVAPYLSWYMRILPRITVPAGLELATGIPVLTITPEDAATRLRAHVPVAALVD
jgi:UDPglucose--hexose-1-phosphate uridylyltransferase